MAIPSGWSISTSELFAYVLEGGARLAEKDIDVDTVVPIRPMVKRNYPLGIADTSGLFAYLDEPGTPPGTSPPWPPPDLPSSLTGESGILWATDPLKMKVFAYNIPGSCRMAGHHHQRHDAAGGPYSPWTWAAPESCSRMSWMTDGRTPLRKRISTSAIRW